MVLLSNILFHLSTNDIWNWVFIVVVVKRGAIVYIAVCFTAGLVYLLDASGTSTGATAKKVFLWGTHSPLYGKHCCKVILAKEMLFKYISL